MSQHAPGPWTLHGPHTIDYPSGKVQTVGYVIRDAHCQWIADIRGEDCGIPASRSHGNAQLIVHAPAMYKALRNLLPYVESCIEAPDDAASHDAQQIHAILQAAEGAGA